ncbi:MAG: endo-1,4-beta-xylanase [Planctomycetota bacterium]
MLSFLILQDGTPATDRVLRHAHVLGPESVPVAAELSFEEGVVRCEKTSGEAAGLAIQIGLDEVVLKEIGGVEAFAGDPDLVGYEPTSLGVLTLQTCLLPERDRPYLLSLELARHRLMLFLNKLEEWNLTDLDREHPAFKFFEAARRAFTQALIAKRSDDNHGFAASTHQLALKSLWLGVEASERLALAEAEACYVPRMTGRIYADAVESSMLGPLGGRKQPQAVLTPERVGVVLPGRPYVGVSVSPGSFAEVAQKTAAETAEFIQMPMRWIELDPSEGSYAFKKTDQWIEWAVRKARIHVAAGPVIDFRPTSVPEWLYIWENDYETLRDYVREHLKVVVTRYRKTIPRWTVVSGLHANDNFHFSFDQMMDLTRQSVSIVRKLHPTAKVIVELTHPWGEYHTANRRSVPPLLYAEMVAQAGVMVDGFGLRVQMGQPAPGQAARDLMAFSAMLDRYAALEKPISLTAVGVPSAMPEAAGSPEKATVHPGSWRGGWTNQRQADWLSAYASVALAKPFIQTVTWHELYDQPSALEMPRGGLIAVDGTVKPAAARMAEIKQSLVNASKPAHLNAEQLLAGTP